MSMCKWFGLLCSSLLVACTATQVVEGPELGTPISQADLASWDISIEADGSGLPPGSGTVEQGERLYTTHCLACHGEEGAGQPHDRLVGGFGTIDQLQQTRTVGSFWPYASTVYDYIRRAMPFNAPQSLSDEDTYALTAYLLYLNGIIDEGTTLNAATLSGIHMPNEDGFIMAYP